MRGPNSARNRVNHRRTSTAHAPAAEPKPQPRRVQLIHKAIALNAAAGDMKTAHQAWEMAPARYRAAMSLCMYAGRFKRRSEG